MSHKQKLAPKDANCCFMTHTTFLFPWGVTQKLLKYNTTITSKRFLFTTITLKVVLLGVRTLIQALLPEMKFILKVFFSQCVQNHLWFHLNLLCCIKYLSLQFHFHLEKQRNCTVRWIQWIRKNSLFLIIYLTKKYCTNKVIYSFLCYKTTYI